MKILYHHRTLGDGAEGIHITEMVNALRQLGHEVRMAGPAAGTENQGTAAPQGGLSSLKKLFRGPAYECLELGYNLAGFAALAKAIHTFQPDLIYDRYITYNYAAVAAARFFRIPVVLEVNAPLAYERAYESDERLYFRKIALAFEKLAASHAHRTIVVSTPLKSYLTAIGVPDEKVTVVPNGVNLRNFAPGDKPADLMAALGLLPSHTIIGFTGILRPWHGIDLLVQAFARLYQKHESARLVLVGDGAIREVIEDQAGRLGCRPGLIITGRVPHDRVKAYIRTFDLAVSPKTTFYASPMKIPEYMAMGKPVVAPDSPNITDLLDRDINGCLFAPNDADSLFKSLDYLVSHPKIREQMGKAALEKARSRMAWEQTAQRILSLVFPDP